MPAESCWPDACSAAGPEVWGKAWARSSVFQVDMIAVERCDHYRKVAKSWSMQMQVCLQEGSEAEMAFKLGLG